MDSTAGDLTHAAKELGSNIEKQISHTPSDHDRSANYVMGAGRESEQHPGSSGSSSEDLKSVEKLDSHIIKVDDIKEGEEAYAHLPPHEKDIVKRQLDIPNVNVTFKTLYRYATRYVVY